MIQYLSIFKVFKSNKVFLTCFCCSKKKYSDQTKLSNFQLNWHVWRTLIWVKFNVIFFSQKRLKQRVFSLLALETIMENNKCFQKVRIFRLNGILYSKLITLEVSQNLFHMNALNRIFIDRMLGKESCRSTRVLRKKRRRILEKISSDNTKIEKEVYSWVSCVYPDQVQIHRGYQLKHFIQKKGHIFYILSSDRVQITRHEIFYFQILN